MYNNKIYIIFSYQKLTLILTHFFPIKVDYNTIFEYRIYQYI